MWYSNLTQKSWGGGVAGWLAIRNSRDKDFFCVAFVFVHIYPTRVYSDLRHFGTPQLANINTVLISLCHFRTFKKPKRHKSLCVKPVLFGVCFGTKLTVYSIIEICTKIDSRATQTSLNDLRAHSAALCAACLRLQPSYSAALCAACLRLQPSFMGCMGNGRKTKSFA